MVGTAAAPPGGGLVDRFGRVATDLRVSLTDRCTLRCSYCMPEEGLEWLPRSDVLTDEETIRLIGVAVSRLGVREVRFTGGEPLLRRGLERIVAATAALRCADGSAPETSLTTNGVGLHRRAEALARAGLSRVNVSVDTLHADRYVTIARRDRLGDVLAGIEAAQAAGLDPVKVNTVLLRGLNEDEAVPLVRWAVGNGHQLRFIEQMPLGPTGQWRRDDMVTAEEILAALSEAFELEAVAPDLRGSAPARLWRVVDRQRGLRGEVGVIASVSAPFCGSCDRTRLTADGQILSCLFGDEQTDLRGMVRAGADDEDLAVAWRAAMWGKPAGHTIGQTGFHQPARPMSAIGG